MIKKLLKTFKPLKRRVTQLMLDYDFEVFDAFNGMVALLWGFVLILPINTFGNSPSYANMKEIAPEWAWGLFIAIVGLTQLLSLVFSMQKLRKEISLAMFASWVFLSISFMTVGNVTTAWAVYPAFAFFSFGSYFHLTFR